MARATAAGGMATARVYVRFVIRHHAGLDLIFDERLRVGDPALAEAGRAVMDVLLPIALDITGDAPAAVPPPPVTSPGSEGS